MGNFTQHITCSTAVGIGVGGIAYHFGFPPSVCLVAAGLCSFAGMLPDIDSSTSKSYQECLYLTAGVASILAASRLRHYEIDPDLAMFAGAVVFLIMRFGLGTLIKKYTAHRGMIHSIPVAILCGQLVFFVVTGTVAERLIKAAALTIGFLSHLVLDEWYSVDTSKSSIRLKRSFGTALKWSNPNQKGLVTVLYATILCLGYTIGTHPEVLERVNDRMEQFTQIDVRGQDQSQTLTCEIQRAAAEFLSQQIQVQIQTPTQEVQADITVPSVLPSAMQIGNDWQRPVLLRPAPIVLQ